MSPNVSDSGDRTPTTMLGVRHLSTIKRFESGKSDPKQSTLLAWRRALSKAGVVFIDPDGTHGPGVMLRQAKQD
jgi:hypothetical protein